ncbi:hypothetical protein J6590_051598 [Homalodisca vitripennis]|nr:hypothetical protein J6590_051598 [Homalodisca vitripennis]
MNPRVVITQNASYEHESSRALREGNTKVRDNGVRRLFSTPDNFPSGIGWARTSVNQSTNFTNTGVSVGRNILGVHE